MLVLVGAWYILQDRGQTPEPSLSPSTTATTSPGTSNTLSPTPSITASVTPRPRKTPQPESTPNLSETLQGPATCQLRGEIKFINADTYSHQDAKLTYQGIDHPARLITWKVTPADNVSVGPNIINILPLPDGETLLYVSLPKEPKYKSYEITAAMNYGRTTAGTFKLAEAVCAGKTIITLP